MFKEYCDFVVVVDSRAVRVNWGTHVSCLVVTFDKGRIIYFNLRCKAVFVNMV